MKKHIHCFYGDENYNLDAVVNCVTARYWCYLFLCEIFLQRGRNLNE